MTLPNWRSYARPNSRVARPKPRAERGGASDWEAAADPAVEEVAVAGPGPSDRPAGGVAADSVRSLTARSSHSLFEGDPERRNDRPAGTMIPMTTLTRDRCPSCGAWLILVEVEYVAPEWRRYPEIGNRVVYECPSCHGEYETWAHEVDPIQEMTRARRSLRSQLASRRPFDVS
jgi:hypothetical protein